MDFDAAADGVDPQAGAVLGDGDLGGVVHEEGDAGIDALQKLADVDVEVALRAHFHSIVCEAPLVAPEGFGLGDGFGPELGAFGGGEVGEGLDAVGFDAGGEGEGAVGLAGRGVLKVEDGETSGLLGGFVGKGTLPGFERGGVGGIAGAGTGFGGEGEREEEK